MPKLPSLRDTNFAPPPGQINVMFQRALVADREGQSAQAIQILTRILSIDPLNTDALNEIAIIQFRLGSWPDAMRHFEALLRIDQRNPRNWKNYGVALLQAGAFEQALICFENIHKLQPADAETGVLHANTLFYLGRFQEAGEIYAPLTNIDPRAAIGLGLTHQWRGRYQDAFSAFDRMINPPHKLPLAVYNKAVLMILLGDLVPGFQLHEQRWELLRGEYEPRSTRPLWLGETSLAGKTLYLYYEQGLGDTLQFCRYATMAAKAGATVILEVQKPLLQLMKTLPGISQLITEDDPVPDHDLRCPLMSLPLAFNTTIDTIPAPDRYLQADPAEAAIWRERLAGTEGKKIGLIWAGASRLGMQAAIVAADRRRSIALEALAPLASIPGCAFFSLQIGLPSQQTAHWPANVPLHDHTGHLNDFADTAAFIENLDLVISVDTSTAHLAGAMGKPVWLLNRFDTCWRWFLERDDTPWYKSMRIFRQPASGDWTSVVQAVTRRMTETA